MLLVLESFTFQYIFQKAIVPKNMSKSATFPAPYAIQNTSSAVQKTLLYYLLHNSVDKNSAIADMGDSLAVWPQ